MGGISLIIKSTCVCWLRFCLFSETLIDSAFLVSMSGRHFWSAFLVSTTVALESAIVFSGCQAIKKVKLHFTFFAALIIQE